VSAGAWWKPGEKEPLICVSEEAARTLAIRPGARTEWDAAGKRFTARVACVYNSEAVRFGRSGDFAFAPPALAGIPLMYFAAVHMRPASVAAFQTSVFDRFPTVTVINAADVLEIVQQVVDQIALVVRFVSLFAILAGVIILATSVAGTRFSRMKEVAVLKTLGASRRKVTAVFAAEFLVLGSVAGLMGSLLAAGFTNYLLTRVLETKFQVDLAASAATIALSAALAVATGWLASYRILRHKPLEVLRSE
jgi:putative ABC transport system permease protein